MRIVTSLLSRTKLVTLIGGLTIGAVLIAAASLLLLVRTQLSQDTEERAVHNQNISIRVGASLAKEMFDGTEITWSSGGNVQRMAAASIPNVADHAFVTPLRALPESRSQFSATSHRLVISFACRRQS